MRRAGVVVSQFRNIDSETRQFLSEVTTLFVRTNELHTRVATVKNIFAILSPVYFLKMQR
jgi:hypothetical protein